MFRMATADNNAPMSTVNRTEMEGSTVRTCDDEIRMIKLATIRREIRRIPATI